MTDIQTTAGKAHALNRARRRAGKSWQDLADAIDRPLVWTVAALLGKHPLTPEDAQTIAEVLSLDAETSESLAAQPYRTSEPQLGSDPTIYRFHEAIEVYGPAIKELIHEQFGDGIMSAINFSVDFAKQDHPDGDRIVVVFNGKFLPYQW